MVAATLREFSPESSYFDSSWIYCFQLKNGVLPGLPSLSESGDRMSPGLLLSTLSIPTNEAVIDDLSPAVPVPGEVLSYHG